MLKVYFRWRREPNRDAYKLRVDKKEKYLSVDWYEYFLGVNSKLTEKQILNLIKEALIQRNYTPKNSGVFSFHSVAKIKSINTKDIIFDVKRTDKKSSHSGIFPKPIRLYDSEKIAKTVQKIIPLENL